MQYCHAAMSINPRKSSAYSEDLRWRIVWQREALGLTLDQVAGNLGVDPSTVSRIARNFEVSGSVQKKTYPKNARPNKKLTKPVQLVIFHTLVKKPQMYLQELQQEICIQTGVYISVSSLCTFLKTNNFTRQKLRLVAEQQDDELRHQFFSDVSLYTPEMCIFVDETGSDHRDSLRRYGYSIRGKPPKSCQLLERGDHYSAIAAMTGEGIQSLRVVRTTVDGDIFLDFVQHDLLPILMPFNGTNRNCVVIMDNCSVHHVSGVESMITSVGAFLHYLPPYSPDLNPIEECFSKVKSCLKTTEVAYIEDHETAILAAFASVTPSDCQSWIRDSKVYS